MRAVVLFLLLIISSVSAERYAVLQRRQVFVKHVPELLDMLSRCKDIVLKSNVSDSPYPALFHRNYQRANALYLSMSIPNLMIPEKYYHFVREDVLQLRKAFTEILKALEMGVMAGKPFHRLDGLDERWRRLFDFVHKYSVVLQENCFSYACFGLNKNSVQVHKKRRN